MKYECFVVRPDKSTTRFPAMSRNFVASHRLAWIRYTQAELLKRRLRFPLEHEASGM
jgi:hypothetical protein